MSDGGESISAYQPTSAANWRELDVTSVEAEEPPEGGRAITMSGVFHDAAISDGYLNDVWGTVHFALITNDGAGDYATSGVLLNDGTIEGVTHSIGNGFLAPWTAARFDVETEVPADVPANGSVAQADVRQIMGSWQVDLRPQPDAGRTSSRSSFDRMRRGRSPVRSTDRSSPTFTSTSIGATFM